jgi:hypothetical protein
VRAETLLAAFKRSSKRGFVPTEKNEFLEIATALGRILTNVPNEKVSQLFREFLAFGQMDSPEIYVAQMRIDPGYVDPAGPIEKNVERLNWKAFSAVAQAGRELATLEPLSESGKKLKSEMPTTFMPLAYEAAESSANSPRIKAAPEILRAYANRKIWNPCFEAH